MTPEQRAVWMAGRTKHGGYLGGIEHPNGFTGVLVECASMIGISKESAAWRWKNWGTFEKGEAWQELQKQPSRRK